MTRKLIKNLPFDIAARVPLQLGRESIGSSTAAVAELIKNSYDANAENVKIIFAKQNSPIQILQIEDDGHGMDLETLETVWLRIGTERKVDVERSIIKERVFTGAKGLGRLGIDRLCRKLIMQTKTAEMDHFIEVHIDWHKYDDRNATINSVTHKIFKTNVNRSNKYSDFFKNKENGTRLILIGLKEKWGEQRLRDLRNELSLLVSPFSDVNDFSVDFASGIEELDGNLSSEKYLEAAAWTVSAQLDVDGNIFVNYIQSKSGEGPPPIATTWSNWLPERDNQPSCGSLSLKFFYIPQPDSSLSTSFKKKDWRHFMKVHQGLRIYRDNFRVRPYGEPTGRGDWLDLGLRKVTNPSGIRQGGWKISPNQILGAIFISRIENPRLIDQANREGMVETIPFFDMRAFTLKVIASFESIATEYARRDVPDDAIEASQAEFENTLSKSREAVASLSKHVDNPENIRNEEVKTKLEEVEKFFEAAQAASVKQKTAYSIKTQELEREKDTLANLASLGILTVCFGHEAKEYCNIAAISAINLRDDIKDGKFMLPLDIEKDVLEDIKAIIDSTKFIKAFSAFSLGNVQKDKRKKGIVNVYSVVERVFSVLSESLKRQNILVDYENLPKDIQGVNGYEIDWESILVNMISNSVWAMTKVENRTIKLSGKNFEKMIELRFMDSGCGIEAGAADHIFKPMYSTRRDERGNAIGTGMGLSIVRTFIEDHAKGTIRVISNGEIGGAEFILTLPVMEKA